MPGAGDILGGLANIGALGGHGAYQGAIEGRVLKSNLEAQETENQLRMLRLLNEQARGEAPIGFGPGTMVFDPRTKQWNQVPFAPRNPMAISPGWTAIDPTGRPLYTAPAAPQRPVVLGPGQTAIGLTGEPLYSMPAAPGRPITLGPGHIAIDPTGRRLGEGLPVAPRLGTPHYTTDAQGNVTVVTPTPAEGGGIDYSKTLLGQIGRPSSTGGFGPGGVKETIEESTRFVPRRTIHAGSDTFKALQLAMPDVITELSAFPGFATPGTAEVTFRTPDGRTRTVRKEEIIRRAFKQKFGTDVEVRWEPAPTWFNKDAGEFRVVRAWEPEIREQLEKRRTVGPPRAPQQSDTEDEE